MKVLPEYNFKASRLNLDRPLIRRISWEQSPEYDDTTKHTHAYCELLFFFSGDGIHELAYQKHRIYPMSIHLVNPGVAHRVQRSKGTRGCTLAFNRSAVLEEQSLIILDILGLFYPILSGVDPKIYNRLLELIQLIGEDQKASKSRTFLFNTIIEIIVEYAKEKGIIESGNMNGFHHFLDYLFNNRKHKPRAHDVSQYMNMTVEHLNSWCNQVFNCSTEELIAKYLMEWIKRDLMFSTVSIKELAYDWGFHDSSHFVKYFKKHEGRTPGQFRKSLN